MTAEKLYKKNDKGRMVPDVEMMRAHLLVQGVVDKACVEKILEDAKKVFGDEPNALTVHSPCVAIGDIHG